MARISALYCHIPFCRTICPFCAFAVHGNRAVLHRGYLDALKEEIARSAAEFQGSHQHIGSLYLGGGTPSTLSLSAVEDLLDWIARHFHLTPGIEIAFEVNPEDAAPEYLRGLRRAGVNRLSLGLQSLDDSTLSALKRNHNAQSSRSALEAMQEEGPENHNIDLMFGIPSAPEDAFQRDLEQVAAFSPPHISLYALDLEPGTLFARDSSVASWMEAHGTAQDSNYLIASEYLIAQGYRHYEVSNFCLPGREGKQNLAVWGGRNYLGFGTGAHSCVDGHRWWNHRHLKAYLRCLGKGATPVAAREALTNRQMANEALMLSLRQQSGLDVTAWERRWNLCWGNRREAISAQLDREGKARWADQRLTLTPKGFLLADEATAQLMVD